MNRSWDDTNEIMMSNRILKVSSFVCLPFERFHKAVLIITSFTSGAKGLIFSPSSLANKSVTCFT